MVRVAGDDMAYADWVEGGGGVDGAGWQGWWVGWGGKQGVGRGVAGGWQGAYGGR